MRIYKLIVELDDSEQFQYKHAQGRMLVVRIEFRGGRADMVRLHGWTVRDDGSAYEDEKLRPVIELPAEPQWIVNGIVQSIAHSNPWTKS